MHGGHLRLVQFGLVCSLAWFLWFALFFLRKASDPRHLSYLEASATNRAWLWVPSVAHSWSLPGDGVVSLPALDMRC